MTLFAATFVLRTESLGTWLAVLGILASAGVAVATFLMAMKTRDLARDAQTEIEIGRRQATAAEKALVAATRPWIVSGEDRDTEEPDPSLVDPAVIIYPSGFPEFPIFVRVRLKNVGPGLALIKSYNSWFSGYGQLATPNQIQRYNNLFTQTPVVPSGAEFEMMGRIIATATDWSNATVQTVCFQTVPGGGYSPVGGFMLEVAYTDAGGDDEVTAKIHVQVSHGRECRVHRIDYHHEDSPEPFVSTRVGLPG